MSKSRFSFNKERDLRPWGCYMLAKLPKEHPLVQIDSTHANQGLEGVFLGWHDTTPSVWMYSVKLQRVMCVQDAVFHHDDEYPFLNPKSIITPGMLTVDQINEMHATDRKKGETLETEFDSEKSAALTQPAQNKTSEDWGGKWSAGRSDRAVD
eukprot:2906820-Rhodomonas_salina.1